MLTVTSNPPSFCSAGDVASFQALVREGGEVESQGLPQRIACAERLAFAHLDRNLIGVGAFKSPNPRYRKSVFAKSASSHPPTAFPLELGWVFVKPAGRGVGVCGRLVKELMATVRGENVFATSRTDNFPMHRCLERCGFECEGKPYTSGRRRDKLALFVRVNLK